MNSTESELIECREPEEELRLCEEKYRVLLKSFELLHQELMQMKIAAQSGSGIAHDLDNLLTIISGYCELISKSLPQTGPLKNSIQHIDEAVREGKVLTEHLLNCLQKS